MATYLTPNPSNEVRPLKMTSWHVIPTPTAEPLRPEAISWAPGTETNDEADEGTQVSGPGKRVKKMLTRSYPILLLRLFALFFELGPARHCEHWT